MSATGRKALLRGDLPENFTRSLYRISPYKGCAHGCRYCDGRAEKYYVEGDFERDIEKRVWIPEQLERELPKLRERGMISLGSGVTDAYQHCEKSEKITRRIAGLLCAGWRGEAQASLGLDGAETSGARGLRRFPAMVMTKSIMAMRDLELWSELNRKAGFVLMVSLTSLDEELHKLMEPGSSGFHARLSMIRAFKNAGCRVGVLAMPFLPGLSDSEDSIQKLYEACSEAGVDFLMPGGLTLRPGRQKELYLSTLKTRRPDLLPLVLEMYGENRQSGAPAARYSRELQARISRVRSAFSLPWLLPHRAYAELLPAHDTLRVLLRDMIELYADKGVDTAELRAAAGRYDAWLISTRRRFRRQRSLPGSWLEESLAEALHSGRIGEILGNKRLTAFVMSCFVDGAFFDYLSMKLER
jgi:DNA repair photolyase